MKRPRSWLPTLSLHDALPICNSRFKVQKTQPWVAHHFRISALDRFPNDVAEGKSNLAPAPPSFFRALLFSFFGGRGSGSCFRRLFEGVEFLAQLAVRFLQVKDFLAQVFEIIDRLAPSTKISERALGSSSFGGFLRGAGESFEHGDCLRIAQGAEGTDGRALNGFLFVIYVINEEFPDRVLLFFVAGEISEGVESLSETAAGECVFALRKGVE